MAGNTMKDITTNFGKLDKFERHDFRRWQNKMHFLLMTLKVVYVLTTPMPELVKDAIVEAIRIRAKWENDDYICRGHILNGMSNSLSDVDTNVKSAKELWDSLKSKYMAEDSSSKKFLVSNFNNYKMVDSRLVMEQYNELLRILRQYTQHGLKMDESISVSSIIVKLPPSWNNFKHTLKHDKDDLSLVQLGSHLRIEESLREKVFGPSVNMTKEGGKNKHHKQKKGKKRSNENKSGSSSNRKPKLECWKCGKTGHFKRDCRCDYGATTHVCKDHCWFKTYELVEDRSVLYMDDDHFAHVHSKGSVALEFSSGKTITLFNVLYVPKLHSVYMSSSSTVVNSLVWHAHLGHVHYKRMLEMSKDDLILAIDENPEKCTTYRGGEYYDPIFFQSVGIIHETIAPYTPQQNGVAKRKNRTLKEMVNSMLSYSGLSEGFWREAMLTDCYLLNRFLNKRNKTTPYELWYKKRPNLSFLRVWGCRAMVRLPDPKKKTQYKNSSEADV
uniref:Zinc finger, CCHC-type n=1 Tax=Tanacetum cinerariifolium TaxID=118510 RepID=A0A6L2L9Y8_TANCI|nr:hypothetical protein [Tanacetum cinerariifolium]